MIESWFSQALQASLDSGLANDRAFDVIQLTYGAYIRTAQDLEAAPLLVDRKTRTYIVEPRRIDRAGNSVEPRRIDHAGNSVDPR